MISPPKKHSLVKQRKIPFVVFNVSFPSVVGNYLTDIIEQIAVKEEILKKLQKNIKIYRGDLNHHSTLKKP